MEWVDHTGKRFGKLLAIEYVVINEKGEKGWLCQCDCGGTTIARAQSLLSGKHKACSCGKPIPKKHGMSGTRAFTIWQHMLTRCFNKKTKCYPRYGGAGITVCDEWRNFENFIADMGHPPEGMSIDRINGTKGYEPGNCRWATIEEQNRNRRNVRVITADGFTGTIQDWSKRTGIGTGTIHTRIKKGVSPEMAVTIPVGECTYPKGSAQSGYCE